VVIASLDPNGPGARSGLAKDDVVVAMNGSEIRSHDRFRNTIATIKPGTVVDLEVVHKNGSKATIKTKLGELPADTSVPERALRRQQQQRRVRPQPQQQQTWP
jgi:S1-C subfamily serine protease